MVVIALDLQVLFVMDTRAKRPLDNLNLSADGKILLSYVKAEFSKINEKIDSKFNELKVTYDQVETLKVQVTNLHSEVKLLRGEIDAAN